MSSAARVAGLMRSKASTGTIIALIAALIVVVNAGVFIIPNVFKSGEARYKEDRAEIDKAVRMHLTGLSPTVIKRVSVMAGQAKGAGDLMDRYPSWAMAKLGNSAALQEEDAGSEEITSLSQLETNPVGSKNRSATPVWEDVDGDGQRNTSDEKLFYHNASPEPAVDHWNTTTVTYQEVDYVVDSRDWLLDFDSMVKKGHLRKVPGSASRDNSVTGTGSYSWYVDENGKLKSLLYSYPRPETDGFQELYP